MEDAGGDTRWATYEELARARGITKLSATRLTLRRKWRRQNGNDGTVRVSVPLTALVQAPDSQHDGHPDRRGDNPSRVSALEGHIVTLQDQLAKAENAFCAARAETAQVRRSGEAAIAEAHVAAETERISSQAQLERLTAQLVELRRLTAQLVDLMTPATSSRDDVPAAPDPAAELRGAMRLLSRGWGRVRRLVRWGREMSDTAGAGGGKGGGAAASALLVFVAALSAPA